MTTDPAMDIAKLINAFTEGWYPELKMASDGAGNNLFVHDMAPSPDFAIAVRMYPGMAPTETFENHVLVRHPRVQIEVRHKLSFEALRKASDLVKDINVTDEVVNGTKYQRIKAIGEPNDVGPDSSNRQRATVNFQASYYDTVEGE